MPAPTRLVFHDIPFAHSGAVAAQGRTVYVSFMTPDVASGFGYAASRVSYAAGDYIHPPTPWLQLRLVRRGSSYARIDLGRGLKEVFTRPGDLLLSLPGSATRFQIDDGRDLTLLQVDLERTQTLLAQAGAAINDLAPLTDKPFRDPLIAEICRRMEEPDFVAPVGLHALSLVMGLLLLRARKQVSRVRRRALSERSLGAVVRHIDVALGDTITVERLARLANMPIRQFSTGFRQALGLPVYQYVLRRRSARARELLTSTDLSLAEIAQNSGFTHQSHMSRVLKRLLGMTPAQIRNRPVKQT